MMTSIISRKRRTLLAALALGVTLAFTGLLAFAFTAPSAPAHADPTPSIYLSASAGQYEQLRVHVRLASAYIDSNPNYTVLIRAYPVGCSQGCSKSEIWASLPSGTTDKNIDLASVYHQDGATVGYVPLNMGVYTIFAEVSNGQYTLDSNPVTFNFDRQYNITIISAESGSPETVADNPIGNNVVASNSGFSTGDGTLDKGDTKNVPNDELTPTFSTPIDG